MENASPRMETRRIRIEVAQLVAKSQQTPNLKGFSLSGAARGRRVSFFLCISAPLRETTNPRVFRVLGDSL